MNLETAILKFNVAAATNGPSYMTTLSIAHPLIYCVLTLILVVTGKLKRE